DKISEFLEEIKVVRESLESIEDSEKLFKRFTLIPKDGEILINTLADELDLCSEIKNFLKLVLWNHRFSEILDICQSYEEVCDREKGRIFHVTFATRFPEEKRKELLDAIRELNEDKGTVKIIENEDESLVGGFQVRHKSKLLDYSVKSQLIRLKAAMRGENRVY
ncbi:MAG: F0F1 ATP synthase subunit delta, partial [Alphaproteobacteria bacterium]|nr:F0F1 ATP synthase subunit delta [Alphaproteobacteria bacterium]